MNTRITWTGLYVTGLIKKYLITGVLTNQTMIFVSYFSASKARGFPTLCCHSINFFLRQQKVVLRAVRCCLQLTCLLLYDRSLVMMTIELFCYEVSHDSLEI